MKIITYRITLLEPALLTTLEGDPNESLSFEYIPGSVLRGAVIGKYMRSRNLKNLDAADKSVRSLFFDGASRYLNAYPLDYQEMRTLPIPLSWYQDKGAVSAQTDNYPAPIYDFAINEHPGEKERPLSVKMPFYTWAEDYVRLVSPKYQLSVHTARNRRYGRAMRPSFSAEESGEPSGAVYRYEALAAGQSFGAFILCDNEKDAELLLPLLEGEIFLGGSRTAGYGQAKIHSVKYATEGWREAAREPVADVKSKLIITFLSNVLIRDEYGQFTAAPDAVTVAFKKELGMKMKLERAFIRTRPVGGFNRKWGLPLPQVLAIRMGSVFIYKLADSSMYMETLLKIETKGIGERRAEGFGRLAFSCHGEEKLTVEPKISTEKPVQIISDQESKVIAERMVSRMFQHRLEGRLIAKAIEVADFLARDEDSRKKLPSNAQISRLRNVIHNELMKESGESPDLHRVEDYLIDIGSRKSAREQFEKAGIERRSLLEWLKDTLNKADFDSWRELLGIKQQDLPALSGIRPQIDESLRKRYILRYIDAILAYAVKKRQKGGN